MMKASSTTHPEVTQESLLETAERIPGAWIGIRVAGYSLMLSWWKSSQVADPFDLSSDGVVKHIRNAYHTGLASI